ncbi:phosphodiester glycosidase family protein [Shimia sp. SDUM112013]|uniref:phosphodiester glycosidase family protein n=1 Tax=Shimia sp. SDUM112013 TaxID=3136160 RepID=UPI0032ECD787
MKLSAVICAAALMLTATAGLAVNCRDLVHEGSEYSVCEADASEDIRLFLRNEEGSILGQFSTVNASLPPEERLVFAMNAGMYHADRSPVGLYIENGDIEGKLLTGASDGNFGLLPNGVLCIAANRVDVVETLTFKATSPNCRYATQSGPMLVINGRLHPRFLVDSTSRHFRNGVGTTADGKRVVFAISNDKVTFHEFGRLFRDALGTPNALFLDGKVSRLYAPELDRADPGFWLGPIVGIVENK